MSAESSNGTQCRQVQGRALGESSPSLVSFDITVCSNECNHGVICGTREKDY